MPVHFLPSAVIHLLLLLLQEAETLSDGVAARHWTISQLAALRVNAQQRPYPLANLASARSLDLAVLAVLEVVLHLCAILRSAGRSIALGGMLDELDVELNVSLPLPTRWTVRTEAAKTAEKRFKASPDRLQDAV